MREALALVALALLAAPAAATGAAVPAGDRYVWVAVEPGLVSCQGDLPDCAETCDVPCSVDACVAFVCVGARIDVGVRPEVREAGFEIWEETNGCPGLQRNGGVCPSTGVSVPRDTWQFAWYPVWFE